MQRHSGERGYALILLLGILATLVILAVSLVMLLGNEQGSTAMERSTKTSLYFGEAALNSAVAAVKGTNSWLTTPFNDSTAQAAMATNYNTLPGTLPSVTYLVYDNATPINYGTNYDANGDGKVWVEVVTTYQGRTTRVRELVQSSTTVSILPKAAAYADTNVALNGTSNIYGVNNDGTPDDSGPPYVTSVMVGGNFTDNSSTNLAYPGHTVQSLGLKVNGTVPSSPALSWTKGGVGLLSDYFDQAHQASLTAEAQVGIPTKANASGTAITSTLRSTLQSTSSQTYTASTDLVEPSSLGNLTLSAKSGATSTFNFKSLYVNGSLTISGNATVNATALYVSGDLTISGNTAAVTDQFASIYVAGKVSWKGGSSSNILTIKTTDYTNSNAAPGPMFAKILSVDGNISSDNSAYDGTSGLWNLVLGPVWVDGDAGTGDIAVNFSAASSPSTVPLVMCPLLATTERTVTNGKVNFGSLASPMIYYMQCDNDGYYSNTCSWKSTGEYFGLMILFEAEFNMSGGNDGTHPNVMGAVLEGTPSSGDDSGTDITMSSNSTICYNQTVIANCTSDSLKTTTTTTVPGTWQQLTSH